jgi:hypothetical protein
MAEPETGAAGTRMVAIRTVIVLVVVCSLVSLVAGAASALLFSAGRPTATDVAHWSAPTGDPKARVQALLKQRDALDQELELAAEQYNRSREASEATSAP